MMQDRISQDRISVEEWKTMFEEIGLDEESMKRWHRIFESRHPEAHRGFLEWLGLSPEKVNQIRKNSR